MYFVNCEYLDELQEAHAGKQAITLSRFRAEMLSEDDNDSVAHVYFVGNDGNDYAIYHTDKAYLIAVTNYMDCDKGDIIEISEFDHLKDAYARMVEINMIDHEILN